MAEKEIWKSIEGYDGWYAVSNKGRIKSLERRVWNGKFYICLPETILSTKADNLILSKEGKSKQFRVRRLVAQTFIPNPLNFKYVVHIDKNTRNNDVNNLMWSKYTHH